MSLDFRGSHVTLAQIALLLLATFTTQSVNNNNNAIRGTAAASTSVSITAFVARHFALPIAWSTIAYVLLLGRYGRLLERRFGTSRFVFLSTFLGTSAVVLSQSLFSAIAAPFLFSSSSSSSSTGGNSAEARLMQLQSAAFFIPAWNPLLIALSAFVALRVPSSRRVLDTLTFPLARRFLYPFAPLLLSTGSVFFNQVLQAHRSLPNQGQQSSMFSVLTSSSSSVSGSQNNLFRAGVSTLCSLVSGVAAAAFVQYYPPMLDMINNMADSQTLSTFVDGIFRSGRNEFYVRQQGAAVAEGERRRDEAMLNRQNNNNIQGGGDAARNLLHGDNVNEDQMMRQAIAASLRGAQQQPPPQNNNNNNNNNNVGRGAAAAFAAAAAANANANAVNNNSNTAMMTTPKERESINFLKEMIGSDGHSEQQLLHVLRSCHGDANQAASILLGM